MAAVGETVQERRCHALALEDLVPFAEGKVGRDQYAAAFVAVGEDPEKKLDATATQRHISQFVTDQEMKSVQLVEDTVERVLLLRLLQLGHQFGRGEKPHPQPLATGGLANAIAM